MRALSRITLKNVLYLTDFSDASESALPFAISIAREYGATVHALHVLIPDPLTYATPELGNASMEAQEESADNAMRRLDAQLTGVSHDAMIVRGTGIWLAVADAIAKSAIDLIVIGTHGRTGAQKALMGSVAEAIFRNSDVPVMTIGPSVGLGVHSGGRFRKILFATDFSDHAKAALPYALSFAEENQAALLLLHAIPEEKSTKKGAAGTTSVAETRALQELVPAEAGFWCKPETIVRHDKPAVAILEVAEENKADLIVLGIRGERGVPGAATHLDRSLTHQIVAFANCPVLTVRDNE